MHISFFRLHNRIKESLRAFLPLFQKREPLWISLSLLPLALFTSWIYICAANHSWLYLLGSFLLIGRLLVDMLETLVSEGAAPKKEEWESLVTYLCPQFADISLLLALAFASGQDLALALSACGLTWASSLLDLLQISWGASLIDLENRRSEAIPALRSRNRLLALLAASLLSLLAGREVGLYLFFLWSIFEGLFFCSLQLRRLATKPTKAN